MNGLDSQLSGMGVAFASSLLGLAGSLVVGLLELFAGHGQNRFYRELEEWLSSITRVGFSSGDGDSNTEQTMVAGILDHMAQQMEKMQNIFASAESSRFVVDEKLGRLADALDNMTRQMEASDNVEGGMQRVAEGQQRLVETLQQLDLGDGFDAESSTLAMASTPKVACDCDRWMCRCCAFLKRLPPVAKRRWPNSGPIWHPYMNHWKIWLN